MHNPLDMVVFAKVVEMKSFSAAAEALDMSRSVISKHVTRLERSLGVRLLNRTTRRLSLTDAGHAVFEHCARISEEAEASEVAASAFASAPRGVLRVSSHNAFGRMHIAPALADLLHRYPDLGVEMVMTDRLVDMVKERFDVAITSEIIPGANLVVCRLTPLRWVVCATEDYLSRHGAPLQPADLERHNCIYFHSQVTPGNVWRFRSPDGETVVKVKGNFRVNNSEAVREAALRGLGVALLPTFALGRGTAPGTLRILLRDHVPIGIFDTHIFVHYVAGRLVPPKVRACVDFLLECFRAEPDWDRAAP